MKASRWRYVTVPGPRGVNRIVRSDSQPLGAMPAPQPTPSPRPGVSAEPPQPTPRLHEDPRIRAQILLERARRARAALPPPPESTPPPTPEQIIAWRKAAGLSQHDLAYRLGISRGFLAGIELGKRQNPDVRRRAAVLLGHPDYAEVAT